VNNPPTLHHCRGPTIASDFATSGVIYGGTDGCAIGAAMSLSASNTICPGPTKADRLSICRRLTQRAEHDERKLCQHVVRSCSCWNDVGALAQLCDSQRCARLNERRRLQYAGLRQRFGDALGMDGRCRPRVRVGRKLDAEGRVSLLVDYGTATYFNPPAVTLPEGFTVVTRDLAIFDSIARVGINYKFGAPVASPGY
jgi:hypothetical protein